MSVDIWPKRGSLKELSLCDVVRSCKAKLTYEHKGELCEAIPLHKFVDGKCVICGEEETDRSGSCGYTTVSANELNHILELVNYYEDEYKKYFDLYHQIQMFVRDNGFSQDFIEYAKKKRL